MGTQLNTIGDRVKVLLTMKKWKQVDLSRKIETTPAHVSQLLKNELVPSSDTICRLARTFQVSSDYLLGLAPWITALEASHFGRHEEFKRKYDELDPKCQEFMIDMIEHLHLKELKVKR